MREEFERWLREEHGFHDIDFIRGVDDKYAPIIPPTQWLYDAWCKSRAVQSERLTSVVRSCPFCGNQDIKDNYVFMECKQCGATGPKMNGGKNDDHADYTDHLDAIAEWNKRA